jgi:hypothetical protein
MELAIRYVADVYSKSSQSEDVTSLAGTLESVCVRHFESCGPLSSETLSHWRTLSQELIGIVSGKFIQLNELLVNKMADSSAADKHAATSMIQYAIDAIPTRLVPGDGKHISAIAEGIAFMKSS